MQLLASFSDSIQSVAIVSGIVLELYSVQLVCRTGAWQHAQRQRRAVVELDCGKVSQWPLYAIQDTCSNIHGYVIERSEMTGDLLSPWYITQPTVH